MKSKLKKLKQLINKRGIHLRNPLHWVKLMGLGFRFVLRHGVKSKSTLKDSFYQMQSAATPVKTQPQTHAQIWERIKPTYSELTKMRWAVPNLKKHYAFTVVISAHDNDTVSSVEKQIYNKFDIIIGTIQETVGKVSGDYVLFLQPGDFLHPNALFELCFELNRIGKTPPLVYFDHDYFVENTVDKPYYKPGWSPDLLLVNNYINRACVFRRDLLAKIEIIDQPFYAALYDILLKLAEFGAGHHKPGILLTMPDSNDERPYDPLENIIRTEALKRRGIDGVIEGNKYGMASLKRNLSGNPKISIIILTCYTKSFIENCLKSIKEVTTYKNYEIIVVDNSRKAPNYGENRLKDFQCKILYVNESFNWSRLNNLGAKEASGDILVFINDDTEIISPDWLERMAVEAQRPEIGMVGPIVLYANGIVQSAGGFKIAHHGGGYHSFLWEPEDSAVYHNFLHYTRNTTYVMGACFIIEKKKFNEVGGLNESLILECNETDFALRLTSNGYNNLTMADVKIIHFERASRNGLDEQPSWKRFWEINNDELQKQDVYFNPYLNSYLNNYSEDPSPTVFRHIGSPSISSAGINKIIIVKLDHIGDVVLSLPAIRKARKLFPDAQIDVLCGPWAKGLLEQQPEINNIWCFDLWKDIDTKKENILSSIQKEKYDLAINLRKYPDTKLLTTRLADYCLLFSEDAATDNISHSVPAIGRNNGHIVKWHFKDQLLSLVNTLEYDETLDKEVSVSSEIRDKVDKIVETMPLFQSNLLIGMHVGSNAVSRMWPIENFSELCDLIHKRTDATIVLFGGENEEPINKCVIDLVSKKDRIISVAGNFSLTEFFYIVKKVDYFIGNNSGPVHVAGIQGISTLVIFGGRHPSSEWMPIGHTISIERIPQCSPCYDYECSQNHCLTKIDPANVFAGLERLMILYPSKRHLSFSKKTYD